MKKNSKLWYAVTCHHKHLQLETEDTFLVRLVKTLDEAKALLQSAYEDAESNKKSKYGIKYSDPKWLDEEHFTLQLKSDVSINGWLHSTIIETYSIHDEWNFNIFSDKSWLLE